MTSPVIDSIIKTIKPHHPGVFIGDSSVDELLKPETMGMPTFLALQTLAEKMELEAAQGRDCLPGFEEKRKEVGRLMDAAPWTLHPDHGCVLTVDVERLDRELRESEDRIDEMLAEHLPPWANGRTTKWTELGAQLRTRDGRKHGNAVNIGEGEVAGHKHYRVVTDIGTLMRMTESELESAFFQPEWKMDVNTHAGARHFLGTYFQDESVPVSEDERDRFEALYAAEGRSVASPFPDFSRLPSGLYADMKVQVAYHWFTRKPKPDGEHLKGYLDTVLQARANGPQVPDPSIKNRGDFL